MIVEIGPHLAETLQIVALVVGIIGVVGVIFWGAGKL